MESTLAGERGIAVDEHAHDAAAVVALLELLRTHAAQDDGIDRCE